MAALVIAVGAPVVGWATGTAVDGVLRQTVRAEQVGRSHVSAVLVRMRATKATDADPETAQPGEQAGDAVARWKTPDGATHTGTVRVTAGGKAGDRIRVWTDDAGRLVAPPMGPSTATIEAVLAGLGSALAAAGTAGAARQALIWQFMRRRLAGWERAWAQAGQSWGRADAGG
jgi:hypothetical protein